MVADGLLVPLLRVQPSLEDFQYEQVELADETARPPQTLVACLNRRGGTQDSSAT